MTINIDALDNLYFDSTVLFESLEDAGAAPAESLVVEPGDFNLELFNKLSPIAQYTERGFRLLENSLWGIKEPLNARGFSINRVVARFDNKGMVMPGTTSLYQAGYKDQSKVLYPSAHPFGEVGKRTQFIGNGFLAEIHMTENGWTFNEDTAIVSHHYSQENLAMKAKWAAEDIMNGVRRGLSHTYTISNDLKESCEKILAGKILHPMINKELIKITGYGEMRLLNQFTYSYGDFGLTKEQHTTVGKAAELHNKIRAAVSYRMATIAAHSGVAAGEYAEFLVFSFPNAFGYNAPKEGYPEAFVNMSHYWNDVTQLPSGILVMAKPAPINTGKAHKPLPMTGNGKRLFTKRPSAVVPLPAFNAIEKAAWKLTPPVSPIASAPDVLDADPVDAIDAFTPVDEDSWM